MRCYLSTPGSLAHAHVAAGANVLISAAYAPDWLLKVASTFERVMWDSGAYTAFTQGTVIDLDAYAERARSIPWADSAACLDDISGDWRQGLANWDAHPWMFPVYHDTDPPEALEAILERLQDKDRGRFRPAALQWIGLGMKPPRNAGAWLGRTLERIPPGVHVHGFAMRGFTETLVDARGSDCSADSINWILDSRQILQALPWLTPCEALDIVVKRYTRHHKKITTDPRGPKSAQIGLFSS
jgi:hypothetical protein